VRWLAGHAECLKRVSWTDANCARMIEAAMKTTRRDGLWMKLPIATWLFDYRPEWLQSDVVAGISVAALVACVQVESAFAARAPRPRWRNRFSGEEQLLFWPDPVRAGCVARRTDRQPDLLSRREPDVVQSEHCRDGWFLRPRVQWKQVPLEKPLRALTWIAGALFFVYLDWNQVRRAQKCFRIKWLQGWACSSAGRASALQARLHLT